MVNVGERVGAILSADEKEVLLLGYGKYEGEKENETLKSMIDELAGDSQTLFSKEQLEKASRNPCIKLDNGKTVWGMECWWGPADRIRQELNERKQKGVTIKEIDIDEYRLSLLREGGSKEDEDLGKGVRESQKSGTS